MADSFRKQTCEVAEDMSLLNEAMGKCIMLVRTTVDDGYGGTSKTWEEGAEFDAAITFNSSLEARIGGAQGVTSLYTITTRKNVVLQYHDVFRRIRDGKVFRVTSDGDDQYTPNSASLDMRQVTGEEYTLE